MEEIKNCPFCGGKAGLREHYFSYGMTTYGVACLECNSETSQFFESILDATEAWNKRVEE